MKCRICGADCHCKRARGGICCGCHSHKVRRSMTAVDRLTEIRAREVYRDQLPLPLYPRRAHATERP